MLCCIADLLVEVPKTGGLAPRCGAYQVDDNERPADIIINEANYHTEGYGGASEELVAYFESGKHFQRGLFQYDGFVLHASAVEYQGKVYLFSAPCRTGKSTHTRLWQQVFGPEAMVINDDKPALRLIDGTWYAYGTPWSGKGPNLNRKAPLAAICFLKQAKENKIRRLSTTEAVTNMLWQTTWYSRAEFTVKKVELLNKLLQTIPVFEMENNMAPECAHLSYETMRKAAEEAGL